MSDSNKLFELIKSLTKSEKRYFKLIGVHTHESSSYMMLFDAIEKQKQYDEEKLKTQFKGKGFIKQFHVIKHYLYQQILKSLVQYNATTGEENKIRLMMQEAQVLYDKNLLNECVKLLVKTKKTAANLELFLNVLWCIDLLKKINTLSLDLSILNISLKEIIKEEEEALVKLANYNNYSNLQGELIGISRKNDHIKDQKGREELNSLMNKEVFNDASNALSKRALLMHYSSFCSYHFMNGDYKKAFNYAKLRIDLFDSERGFGTLNWISGITFLSAMVMACVHTQQFKTANVYKNKLALLLKEKRVISPREKILIRVAFGRLVEAQLLQGSFDDETYLLWIINITANNSKKNELSDTDVYTYYLASYFYFSKRNIKKALYFNNCILTCPLPSISKNLKAHCKLMDIIIHYELNNYLVIENTMKSLTRFFSKKNAGHQLAKLIVDTFKQLILSETNKKKELFINLLHNIKNLKGEEKNSLKYFDFITWVESKIENQPFAIVLKRKNEH